MNPKDDSVKPVVEQPKKVTETSVAPTVEKAVEKTVESVNELPKTGSFMNQTVLLVVAFAFVAAGLALRRKVRLNI